MPPPDHITGGSAPDNDALVSPLPPPLIDADVDLRGLTISLPAITKEGAVIIDPTTGKAAAAKVVSNPALGPLIKLFEVMGINLPELLATPKARRAVDTADEGANAMQMLLGGVMQRMQQAKPQARVIEHGDKTP